MDPTIPIALLTPTALTLALLPALPAIRTGGKTNPPLIPAIKELLTKKHVTYTADPIPITPLLLAAATITATITGALTLASGVLTPTAAIIITASVWLAAISTTTDLLTHRIARRPCWTAGLTSYLAWVMLLTTNITTNTQIEQTLLTCALTLALLPIYLILMPILGTGVSDIRLAVALLPALTTSAAALTEPLLTAPSPWPLALTVTFTTTSALTVFLCWKARHKGGPGTPIPNGPIISYLALAPTAALLVLTIT